MAWPPAPLPAALGAPAVGSAAAFPQLPDPAPGAVPLRSVVLALAGGAGPTIDLHRGDYLTNGAHAICMLTDDTNIDRFETWQLPWPHSMRLDLHRNATIGKRRWHRQAWQDVDRFNVRWGGLAQGRLTLGRCRETTSGLLPSRLTLMLNLPIRNTPILGGGGAVYKYRHLRRCVHRILNRAFNIPVIAANAAQAWRTRPGSIAFHLLGSSVYHDYGFVGAADNILRAILLWFKSPDLTAAQQATRAGAIPTIYLLIPPSSNPESSVAAAAWNRAWTRYITVAGTLVAPLPPPYGSVQRAADDALNTIVLRNRAIVRAN